jgi:hypothetical protein
VIPHGTIGQSNGPSALPIDTPQSFQNWENYASYDQAVSSINDNTFDGLGVPFPFSDQDFNASVQPWSFPADFGTSPADLTPAQQPNYPGAASDGMGTMNDMPLSSDAEFLLTTTTAATTQNNTPGSTFTSTNIPAAVFGSNRAPPASVAVQFTPPAPPPVSAQVLNLTTGRFHCTVCNAPFKRDTDRVRHQWSKHQTTQGTHLCPVVGCYRSQ